MEITALILFNKVSGGNIQLRSLLKEFSATGYIVKEIILFDRNRFKFN